MKEEWMMWIFFLSQNSGSLWKTYNNIFLQPDIMSDASGRAFAGVVDFPAGTSKITAGEFQEDLLGEDIQVKEAEALRAEALRATIHMLVTELPCRN